jgi:hypothetical protein
MLGPSAVFIASREYRGAAASPSVVAVPSILPRLVDIHPFISTLSYQSESSRTTDTHSQSPSPPQSFSIPRSSQVYGRMQIAYSLQLISLHPPRRPLPNHNSHHPISKCRCWFGCSPSLSARPSQHSQSPYVNGKSPPPPPAMPPSIREQQPTRPLEPC